MHFLDFLIFNGWEGDFKDQNEIYEVEIFCEYWNNTNTLAVLELWLS